MKVICISGKAQHGKDTTANFMKDILIEKFEINESKILITHYGDLLKYICRQFFNWDGEKDENGRRLLQYIGTDVVRAKNPDFWANFLADALKMFEDKWYYVLIPDVRFPNEIEKINDKGFNYSTIRVIRPNFDNHLTGSQNAHKSEIALDGVEMDYTLINNGTLDDLKIKISHMLGDIL